VRRALESSATQEFMQWFGLLGAPLAWTVQLVLGYGVTEARCGVGGSGWAVSVDTWEITLMIAAGAVVILAELCATALYFETRDVAYDGVAPVGRRHFFVAASSLGNVLFLVIILLSGIAAVEHVACRQS
jgi:hypothetical protein